MALFTALCDLCLFGAVLGSIFTLIEWVCVVRYPRERIAANAAALPPVTVLKPLHDDEPGLANRLTQFCAQKYGAPLQLIFGVRDASAPAVKVARDVQAAFPEMAIDVVVDPRRHGSNGKVSNLINMLAHARHDTLVLSDSDIMVGPDYLRRVVGLLDLPRAGAATCLYFGVGKGLWTGLSALAINTQFLPMALVAARFRLQQHCCGATIVLRRSMLERIGGFEAFADELADDHAIGAAVRKAGFDIASAPFLVGHCCFEATAGELFSHQLRVARTIKSIAPWGYAGTVITHPLPLALLGALGDGTGAAAIVATALIFRVILGRCVERRFGLPRQSPWLIAFYDLIAFGAYVASYFGTTVSWSGADYRVSSEGMLIERETEEAVQP
jgi:ceramide glucosyltransferase